VEGGDDNILSNSSCAPVVPNQQKYQKNSPPKSHEITAPQWPKLCDDRVEGFYHAVTALTH
jgi:hypothetical protein